MDYDPNEELPNAPDGCLIAVLIIVGVVFAIVAAQYMEPLL